MRILPNVHLERCSPQIILAMWVIDGIVRAVTTASDLTITSAGDGIHTLPTSKHYPDEKDIVDAFDGRVKDFDGNDVDISGIDRWMAEKVVSSAKIALGPQYVVILESNHIHVQFNRKPNEFKNGAYVQ